MSAPGADPARPHSLNSLLAGLAVIKHRLGFRCARWITRAPGLELRIALAGIALEEEGHAKVLEAFLAEESGGVADRERLVTWDSWPGLPDTGTLAQAGWPQTLTDYFVEDSAATAVLSVLAGSPNPRLAQRVARMLQEERFHQIFAVETLASLAVSGAASAAALEAQLSRSTAAVEAWGLSGELGAVAGAAGLPEGAQAAYQRVLAESHEELRAALAGTAPVG